MKYLIPMLLFIPFFCQAQHLSDKNIQALIKEYRVNDRGPFKDIRWFCPNDSIQMPREPCAQKGGHQRARHKEAIVKLADNQHIYLGQILATTPIDDFWDANNYNSRLKQYQLEKFLKQNDNGWILERGQFYRGAFQVEDERAWGKEFLLTQLKSARTIENQFFLLRQAAKSIPHKEETRNSYNVRVVSKEISEAYPKFQDLRVKIHGQPDVSDIGKVINFQKEYRKKLSPKLLNQFEELVQDMELMYQPVNLSVLNETINDISRKYAIRQQLTTFVEQHGDNTGSPARVIAIAEIILAIRTAMPETGSASSRLAMLDISNALEEIYFKEIAEWKPKNIAEVMDKVCYSAMATTGAGFIELWEWEKVEGKLAVPLENKMTLADLNNHLVTARGVVEWGTGMVNGIYGDVVDLYDGFEPMAKDFTDDLIRSSVLLRLGQGVSELGDRISKEAGLSNQLFTIAGQSGARGLNPGYAMGELVVVDGYEEDPEVDNSKIYLFRRPPSSLKPVAGIATVTEGNMVSHVQLLARNLGIPNAVISSENLSDLKRFQGQQVFYAVSNEGTVIMKAVNQMTQVEKDLFSKKERNTGKVTVPTEKIDLAQTSVLNMRQVDATSSGVLCGPKAANLGQLKALFPENVVEGIVIPFGIFREHLGQPMPGQEESYWEFLNQTFLRAEGMQAQGKTAIQREEYVLKRLATLRKAILNIKLSSNFMKDLQGSFVEAFGAEIGKVPVFLRSDTNMEDLEEFTGAGLNLTKFNVVSNRDIIEGIKEVWASPYTERSFKWRQRYLLNPENVFPSILIIPTVDVEYSGVMITKGITTRDGRDVTVAFSRGAGGAVDGQAAETYLLKHDQENILLSPAREPNYMRLPTSGGSTKNKTTFENAILKEENLYQLRKLAYDIHHQFPKNPNSSNHGPFDIELGFKDDFPWLFQVRPFVENKRAKSSTYLESISPQIPRDKLVVVR